MFRKPAERLARVLEAGTPYRGMVEFCMGDWIEETSFYEDAKGASHCGFAGCLAGWTIAVLTRMDLALIDNHEQSVDEIAAARLGLTFEQSSQLFMPCVAHDQKDHIWWEYAWGLKDENGNQVYRYPLGAPRHEAAKVLRKAIELWCPPEPVDSPLTVNDVLNAIPRVFRPDPVIEETIQKGE